MPQLSITTNQTSPSDPVVFRKRLSEKLASWLNKPEDYCMIHTAFDAGLSFGGSEAPAATLELASLGLTDDQPAQLTPVICDFIHGELDIQPGRIYIQFLSPPRTHWGWNRKTFG